MNWTRTNIKDIIPTCICTIIKEIMLESEPCEISTIEETFLYFPNQKNIETV